MALRKLRGVVAVIKETAENTFTNPTAANCILAQDVEYNILEGDAYQRSELNPTFNKMDPIPGPAGASIKFSTLLKGASTRPGEVPEWGTAMLGCGFAQFITSGQKVDYKATSLFDGSTSGTAASSGITWPGPSYTVVFNCDTANFALAGGWGTVNFEAEVGRPIKANFEFQGAYVTPTVSGLLAPTYNTTVPPTFLSASTSIYSSGNVAYASPIFEKLTYDVGNVLALRKNANSSAGIVGAMISDRRPVGSIDPEFVLPTTADLMAAYRTGSVGAISAGAIGATAGNKITLTAARTVYRSVSIGDRNGLVIGNINFDIVSPATDADASWTASTFTLTVT